MKAKRSILILMAGILMISSISYAKKASSPVGEFGYALSGFLAKKLGANEETSEMAANVGSWGAGAAAAWEMGATGAQIGALGGPLGAAAGAILGGL